MENRRRVAIIGGGISGLGSAYLLRNAADITLYEKNAYIGGHSRTVEVEVDGKTVPVDTGFIVYNRRNYPYLTQLFEELEVPVVKSDMSFGVSIDNGWLEYGSIGWKGFLGSLRNALCPRYWKMLFDIIRFNRLAHKYIDAPANFTIGECLNEMGMGDWFRKYYFLPMGGSIWSCPVDQMLKFPASTLIRFFKNHGLLTIKDHPQWYSVLGGSREYVQRLVNKLGQVAEVRSAAVAVTRMDSSNMVKVRDADGYEEIYDEVIIATHPDEALEILQSPNQDEAHILSSFKYQPNDIILHTDQNFMPKRHTAWASWIYRSEHRTDRASAVSLSYWMNNLQKLNTETPVIVTLNPYTTPREEHILDRHKFDHPVFDEKAILAQRDFMKIQGKDRIWYCGAYQRNGFHEDGLWSAVRVVKEMGIKTGWH